MVARCCCGELEINVSGEPTKHGICHCDNCKKRTGSAFGISVYFSKGNMSGVSFSNLNMSEVEITDANLEGMKINGILVSDLTQCVREKQLNGFLRRTLAPHYPYRSLVVII